jgi:hypothetical protein
VASRAVTRLVALLVGAALLIAVTVGTWRARGALETIAYGHAIYASTQLVDQYCAHWQRHGRWPQPGMFAAKEVEFLHSSDLGHDSREDVYDFGGGRHVAFRLSAQGRIQAFVRRPD